MTNVEIKIVGIDELTKSILVKYASHNSAKPTDEYDAVAFTLGNYTATTQEEFIAAIYPSIQAQCEIRDADEKAHATVDVAQWVGSVINTANIQVAPVANPGEVVEALPSQTVPTPKEVTI